MSKNAKPEKYENLKAFSSPVLKQHFESFKYIQNEYDGSYTQIASYGTSSLKTATQK